MGGGGVLGFGLRLMIRFIAGGGLEYEGFS